MIRRKFDLRSELQKAWDWCWKFYCEPTSYEVEEFNGEGYPTGKLTGEVRVSGPRQTWLSATDLERRIRAAACEALDNAPVGAYGPDGGGNGIRISTPSGTGLLEEVRQWLAGQLIQHRLEGHNFGRGHCSGMRFRPAGSGVPEGEAKKIKERQERLAGKDNRPIHYRETIRGFGGRAICTAAQRASAKAKYRGAYYGGRPTQSSARLTNEPAKVTCPRCLKLLAAQTATAAP